MRFWCPLNCSLAERFSEDYVRNLTVQYVNSPKESTGNLSFLVKSPHVCFEHFRKITLEARVKEVFSVRVYIFDSSGLFLKRNLSMEKPENSKNGVSHDATVPHVIVDNTHLPPVVITPNTEI